MDVTGKEKDNLAEGLRKRTVKSELLYERTTIESSEDVPASHSTKSPGLTQPAKIESGTYWLTRILLLRYLGFIYCRYYLYKINKQVR